MTNPITAGEILSEEYLKPMGISHSALAIAIGVGPETIAEIVNGNLAITPAISIRLGDVFGQSGEFWHGIQMECDSRNPVRPNTRGQPNPVE